MHEPRTETTKYTKYTKEFFSCISCLSWFFLRAGASPLSVNPVRNAYLPEARADGARAAFGSLMPSPPAPLPSYRVRPAGEGSDPPSPPAPLPSCRVRPAGEGSDPPSPPAPLPFTGEGRAERTQRMQRCSFVAERFDGIEAAGLACRVVSEEHADRAGEQQGGRDGRQRDRQAASAGRRGTC